MAKDDKSTPNFSEIGVSGLSRFNGTITEEYLKEIQGDRGRKTLKQMAHTDPTVGALLFAIKQMIRSADWHVRPSKADKSKDGRDAADFVYECIHDMSRSWPSTISSICSMFTYGWDYREIVYKKRSGRDGEHPSKYNDGLVGIRKLAERSQMTLSKWEFDSSGGIKGMWQRDPQTYETKFIPIEKALLFRPEDETGNPEGRSVLANAYPSWYYVNNLKEIEGIGAERNLVGIPVIRAPIGILQDSDKSSQLSDLKDIVTNLRVDEQMGIILPYDPNNPGAYSIELLSSPGESQYQIDDIIDRYKTEVAQVVIADFILLGHRRVGSFALARAKKDAFGTAIYGWLDSIRGVLNSHMLPRLLRFNPRFVNIPEYPEIVFSIAKVPTLDELSGLVRALAFGGYDITSDKDIMNSILDEFGLPRLSEEQEAVIDEVDEGEISTAEQINEIVEEVSEEE